VWEVRVRKSCRISPSVRIIEEVEERQGCWRVMCQEWIPQRIERRPRMIGMKTMMLRKES
jgi:hypothetical protein